MPETETTTADAPPRTPCPAPADFRRAVADYDAHAEVSVWTGPRYRMTYRVLGQGPPLILIPGVSSTYRGYAQTLNLLAKMFTNQRMRIQLPRMVRIFPGEQSCSS